MPRAQCLASPASRARRRQHPPCRAADSRSVMPASSVPLPSWEQREASQRSAVRVAPSAARPRSFRAGWTDCATVPPDRSAALSMR
eukprot:4427791-Pleurochrysis_carterae.AAC.4